MGKDINKIKVVFNGAGASGIACAEHYVHLGVKRENITMVDTKGVIYEGRAEGMNPYKARFAGKTKLRTLAEAVAGCDVLVCLSVKGAFTPDMIRSMAGKPVVFAMANPDPEITYEDATAVRQDLIMATGRSDYPNQVNNVLGFPFIFRGALDVHATAINEEMKVAATKALAELAKEDVPASVCRIYGVERLKFGPDYIIPKPFDPRVLVWEASAVAQAATKAPCSFSRNVSVRQSNRCAVPYHAKRLVSTSTFGTNSAASALRTSEFEPSAPTTRSAPASSSSEEIARP